MRYMYFRN